MATGLGTVGSALYLLGTCGVDTGYGRVALALSMMGVGMSLAMSPATESIMGSLPKAKAGIGSAMNDVVREVGGTLGVAVLGSVLASSYGNGMDGAVRGNAHTTRRRLQATASVARTTWPLRSAASAAANLTQVANQSFVDAMSTTATLAAGVALAGALIAAAFLPSRARAPHATRTAGAGGRLVSRERR